MNILEAEDMVKGLPDQVLFQYAQNPPPQIPQYLAVSEVQRRQEMRQRFQAQSQGQQPTVMDQILQGGSPEQAPQGGPPGGAPPGAAPPGAPMEQPMTGAPMGGMFRGGMTRMANGGLTPGGIVYMQEGRTVPNFLSAINSKLEEYSNANRARTAGLRPQDPNAVIAQAKDLVRQGRTQEAVGLLSQEGIDPSVLQAAPPAPPAAQIPAPGPLRRGAVEPPSITPVGIAAAVPPPAAPASAAPPAPAAPPVTPPVTPPADTAPAGFSDPTSQAFDSLLSRLPATFKAVSALMPSGGGINPADLERFAPTAPSADFSNQREALITQLREQGEARRKEDIAAAERYRKESEAPIQQAQEQARKAAIASTLMRLGSGLAAGKPAEGLASASESVEQIMTRAREQAGMERRAAQQEFRAAEREATRSARSIADTAFQMQASNITANESAQREFARDQKSFAQWAYGQMRDAGRETRQAQGDAIRLSIGITQSIDQAVRDALKTRSVSENQYTETFGTVFKEVLKEIKMTDWGTDDEGNVIVPTAEQLLDTASKQTDAVLSKRGIVSPSSVVTVTSPQDLAAVKSGQRYRGPDGIVRVKP